MNCDVFVLNGKVYEYGYTRNNLHIDDSHEIGKRQFRSALCAIEERHPELLILDSFPFDTDDDGSVNVLDYNEIVSAIFTNPEDVASAVLANSPVGGATQHMTARTIPPTSNRRYFFKDLYSEYFDGIALPVDIDNNGLYWVAFDFGNFTQGDGLLYNYYIVWKGCIPAHAPVATSSIP